MARHDPRCLPSTRTLPRIRWPLQPRSHDRPTAFGVLNDRWMPLSRHPGSWPVLHPVLLRSHLMKSDSPVIDSLGPDVSSLCFRIRQFTVPSLGHCSLGPPLFLERCVRAYSRPGCCLPTSATTYDVRTLDPGSSVPRRDDGHDHPPFLARHAGNPSRDGSGDVRRAAHFRPSR